MYENVNNMNVNVEVIKNNNNSLKRNKMIMKDGSINC